MRPATLAFDPARVLPAMPRSKGETEMTDVTRVMDATSFAARHHHGQLRKGAVGEPYIVHLLDVAGRLAAVHPEDDVLILAGLLHDTVEDTDVTDADLRARYGAAVADLVAEVTDDKALPKAERKRAQVAHVRHASDRAKRLKLADKASNLTSLAHMPPDWTVERKRAYIDWALEVIDPVRGLDPALEAAFDTAVAEARMALG